MGPATQGSSFLLLLLSVFCSVLAIAGGDAPADALLLLEIKAELVDPGGALRSWYPGGGDACRWNGVTCSDDGARIVGLNLSSSGLMGSVPPVLGRLGSLESLDLSSNSLTGKIPPELGTLENLTELLLYSNSLSGGVPPELGCEGSSSGAAFGGKEQGRETDFVITRRPVGAVDDPPRAILSMDQDGALRHLLGPLFL